MKQETDLRPQDIEILQKYGVEFDWVSEWENKLCNKSDNQTLWHLSRLSYLAGYLKAKEELLSELVEYKELIGSPYLQSQVDKRKEIEEWMNKKGRSENDNFNKAIIAHFIKKHKEVAGC